MQTTIPQILILCFFFLLGQKGASLPDDLARGLLHADGILTVVGGDVEESLITVMPANGASYTLAKGTKAFSLKLELNNTYLVTFEHPKCLTKQLYFDTNVPKDYQLDEYGFPFEVVLEVERSSVDRAYVGPVGYIMYMELVNDFDYETDYTLKIDERLKERMDAMSTPPPATDVTQASSRSPQQSNLSSVSGSNPSDERTVRQEPSDPSVKRVGSSSKPQPITPTAKKDEEPVERIEAPEELEPVMAETISQPEERPVPVQAEVAEVPETLSTEVAEPEPVEELRSIEEDEIADGEPLADEEEEVVAEDMVLKKADTTTPRNVAEKAETTPRLPTSPGISTRKYLPPDPTKAGRQEELIVEENKVTTIVRIVNDLGYAHEYRRVAHKFGPVFYFKDEQSIPEHMYRDETGMPAE